MKIIADYSIFLVQLLIIVNFKTVLIKGIAK